MPKIADTGVPPSPADAFGDNNDMVRWDTVLDDGRPCEVYRKISSPPLVVGEEVELTGVTKKGARKGKVAGKFSGGGGGGYSGSSDDKMRSKEQCMRGEAVIAASNTPHNATSEGLFIAADKIYKYIEGEAPVPASVTASGNPSPLPQEAQTDEIPF